MNRQLHIVPKYPYDFQPWHDWRAEGIGASDAPVIKKLFPFGKTPYQLWEQKRNLTVIPDNEAMKHGRDHEESALAWVEKKMDCSLHRQVRVENKSRNFIRATLDGIDPDLKILVEVKVPYNLENHSKTKETGQIPEIYYPQCQHQLIAAEGKFEPLDGSYYVSYNYLDEDDSVIIENPRNDDYIADLIIDLRAFWDCVITNTPPELTDRDYILMDNHFEWFMLATKKIMMRSQRLDDEKVEEAVDERIKELAGYRNAVGAGLKATKCICPGSIDYKKAISEYLQTIRSLYPSLEFPDICLDSYRKESFTKWLIKPID